MTEWCTCNKLKEAEEKAAKWDAIVRCGECVHAADQITHLECERSSGEYFFVPSDHFCKWGERRDA